MDGKKLIKKVIYVLCKSFSSWTESTVFVSRGFVSKMESLNFKNCILSKAASPCLKNIL